jgi:CheY-like chemotaxis protein
MASERCAGSKLTILAVEDDMYVAQAIALVLGGSGCTITLASGVTDALNTIEQHAQPFDVVITDHSMPELSGLELVRRLREDGFAGKIVVLSAYVSSEDEITYRSIGIDAFLSKPFGVAELRGAVGL